MAQQQSYKLARFAKYGPPCPTQEEKTQCEKGFVLDSIAVSTLSDDSGRANPKMATAIPPYNAQKDKHSKGYFEKPVVKKLLRKTEQVRRTRIEMVALLCSRSDERKLHLICKFHIPGRNLEQISTWGKCGVDCSCKSRNEITNENDLFLFKKKVIFRSKSF